MVERVPIVQTVYSYPTKVVRPAAPKLELYNTARGLDDPSNFRKFQRNTLLMTDYIISLQTTIQFYEQEIDRLQSMDKK